MRFEYIIYQFSNNHHGNRIPKVQPTSGLSLQVTLFPVVFSGVILIFVFHTNYFKGLFRNLYV
jgi:hypothetical protein